MKVLRNIFLKRNIFVPRKQVHLVGTIHFSSTVEAPNLNKKALSPNNFNVTKFLSSKIKTSGPITVAEFMKAVLSNPLSGYYVSNKDVLGSSGDFITSPEISQLFGEIIALWFVNEWHRIGSPKPMQIVELGPGKGTMMSDILRVFDKLKLSSDISCHLVEISTELSKIQANTLGTVNNVSDDVNSSCRTYQQGTSSSNVPLYWYKALEDVPRQFSCVIAHEFFDALPIHKFQKTENGWREILVDIDPNNPDQFRYVISRMATPASSLFVKKEETREHVEVCPKAGVIIQDLATRLKENGGIALIADYGHSGDKTDTFRAFKKHKLHDPLVEPGSADLTADVDFQYLLDCVSDKLVTYGPVTQRQFLHHMHADKRLQILLQNCETEEDRNSLISGFQMMTEEDKMGNCFKFLALYPMVLKDYLSRLPPPVFV